MMHLAAAFDHQFAFKQQSTLLALVGVKGEYRELPVAAPGGTSMTLNSKERGRPRDKS